MRLILLLSPFLACAILSAAFWRLDQEMRNRCATHTPVLGVLWGVIMLAGVVLVASILLIVLGIVPEEP